jgi:hypothetical protein
MTNKEILAFAEDIHHAHLPVGPNFSMCYGKDQWEEQLPMLSEWQRDLLVRRIEYWTIPATRN